MRQRAIHQAKARLERVKEAVISLNSAELDIGKIQAAWWSFILAANGIFSQLEQGAKGDGPSTAWFGRKKFERKNDELLSYLHHARNSEEHTIEGSTGEHGIHFTAGNEWTKVESSGPYSNEISVSSFGGKPVELTLHAPGVHLLPVRDRGIIYQPPKQHLGQPLSDQSIEAVLLAAETYLANLIEEASNLPMHD